MNEESKETSKYIVETLAKHHIKDEFNCGIDILNNYLKYQATQDMRKNVAVSYALTRVGSNRVLGYYTLSSIGIRVDELPADVVKKLPRYPVLPGILVGRLARDIVCQGEEIGKYLLLDALKRSLNISAQLGSVAVIVDAKNEKAVKFYKNYGFLNFLENNFRLFIAMGTIKKLTL
jgi:predicted GNAT family N-acyltransferase